MTRNLYFVKYLLNEAYLTFFASSAPALNLTTFFAGMVILAPVAGLTP